MDNLFFRTRDSYLIECLLIYRIISFSMTCQIHTCAFAHNRYQFIRRCEKKWCVATAMISSSWFSYRFNRVLFFFQYIVHTIFRCVDSIQMKPFLSKNKNWSHLEFIEASIVTMKFYNLHSISQTLFPSTCISCVEYMVHLLVEKLHQHFEFKIFQF